MALTALQQVDLTADQSADFSRTWIFASADSTGQGNRQNDTYYNFTGSSARLNVRQYQDVGSTSLLALTIGSGLAFTHAQEPGGPADPGAGAPNALAVTITAAQLGSLTPGVYYYNAWIDYPNGTHQVGLSGRFIVGSTL